MPDSNADETRQPAAASQRSASERAEDHRAVEQLAEDLLPALMAKLSSSGLAELEVREGPWNVRLRRPMEVVGTGRRATDRHFRLPVAGAPAGHAAPVHAAGHPVAAPGRAAGSASATVSGQTGGGHDPARAESDSQEPVVTSPAVGIFRPRAGISGTRVRAGDWLGAVDMLGIPQEVVAPIDGFVGRLLVEAADGVEYGQPLIAMQPASAAATASDPAAVTAPDPAAIAVDGSGVTAIERAAASAGERS